MWILTKMTKKTSNKSYCFKSSDTDSTSPSYPLWPASSRKMRTPRQPNPERPNGCRYWWQSASPFRLIKNRTLPTHQKTPANRSWRGTNETKASTSADQFVIMKQLLTSNFSSRKDCLMSLLHQYCNEVKKCPHQPRPMGAGRNPFRPIIVIASNQLAPINMNNDSHLLLVIQQPRRLYHGLVTTTFQWGKKTPLAEANGGSLKPSKVNQHFKLVKMLKTYLEITD